MSIAILIPTYNRVGRLQGVVDNAQTPDATVYLIMEPDEAKEFEGAVTITRPEGFGTYAKAINHAYRVTEEPYLFCGADDLNFKEGWAHSALRQMKGNIQVVGTNDLSHPAVLSGEHATHYLVARHYLDTVGGVYDEGPGSFLPECYDHNWTDTEFIQTARHRGVYMACLESVVEHNHPTWGKAPMDDTYAKSFRGASSDARVAQRRLREMAEWVA